MVLPPGVVCDSCNNYFAVKIEKPFMDAPVIEHMRFSQVLPGKRGRAPRLRVESPAGMGYLVPPSRKNPQALIFDSPEAAIHAVTSRCTTITSHATPDWPAPTLISRLLGKVALEYLAFRLLPHEGGIDYLVDEVNLDPLRNHARRGQPARWNTSVRRIYEPDSFLNGRDGPVQPVWEATVHETEVDQYFVMAWFGTEFAIRLGDPDLTDYRHWLIRHGGVSPLYAPLGKDEPPLPARPIRGSRGRNSTLIGWDRSPDAGG